MLIFFQIISNAHHTRLHDWYISIVGFTLALWGNPSVLGTYFECEEVKGNYLKFTW